MKKSKKEAIARKIIKKLNFAQNLYNGGKQKILNIAAEGKKLQKQRGGVFKGKRRQRGGIFKGKRRQRGGNRKQKGSGELDSILAKMRWS